MHKGDVLSFISTTMVSARQRRHVSNGAGDVFPADELMRRGG